MIMIYIKLIRDVLSFIAKVPTIDDHYERRKRDYNIGYRGVAFEILDYFAEALNIRWIFSL